jgi:hypothetical protein
MIAAQYWLDAPCAAGVALRRAEALCGLLTDTRPALFYGARLTGTALALGAYQREAFVVAGAAGTGRPDTVVRRQTGGGAVVAGEGVFYFAVALESASVLMDCPPGRILNRNVRGLLQGFRSLGVPAHYFGRDFVSLATRAGAHVAWHEREDGRVLFEAFISQSKSYVPPASWIAYPPLNADPFRGRPPVTLSDAAQRTVQDDELFAQLIEGYATTYKLDARVLDAAAVAECARQSDMLPKSIAREDDALAWSPPYEESIGFVYAGVRVSATRQIAQARLGGDYFQSQRGQRAVEEQLIGCSVDGTEIGRVINDVYADTRHVIEGIRQMDSLRAVVLFAAERAADVAQADH